MRESAPMMDALPPGSPMGRTINARIEQAQAVHDVLGDVLGRLEV